MARTTSTLVQGLLKTDYDGSSDLTPYIDTASSVMDDVVVCAARKGKTLSNAKLEIVERWLSAHFYCVMDGKYTSKSTSGASGSFQGSSKEGFESTTYGQQATRLDPSGCLANIQDTQVATGLWLGKPPSQQIPYSQRN